jgi:hypothetical protein
VTVSQLIKRLQNIEELGKHFAEYEVRMSSVDFETFPIDSILTSSPGDDRIDDNVVLLFADYSF